MRDRSGAYWFECGLDDLEKERLSEVEDLDASDEVANLIAEFLN